MFIIIFYEQNINGDFVKKILLLIFVCLLFGIISVSSNDSYYIRDDSYNIYSISINNLNTKNFFSYFDGICVIRIFPKINPIYKNVLGNLSYKFSSTDINSEISLFNKYYLSIIKKNSYSDYNYLYINGIDIDKVFIYISEKDLYNFLNKTGAYIN